MLSQAKEEKMAKLTDSQLIVLSKAAARNDGAAVIPERMNRAAVAKVGSSLVARKLMREIRSKPGTPIWREDEDKRRISLIITRAGRDAIGVADDLAEAEPLAAAKSNNSRPADVDHQPLSGLPRAGSKQALVVAMLSKDKGVTLDALIEATGWLPHTTRAAMTGLRKRGFAIERTRTK
jgi:hypothetical protein